MLPRWLRMDIHSEQLPWASLELPLPSCLDCVCVPCFPMLLFSTVWTCKLIKKTLHWTVVPAASIGFVQPTVPELRVRSQVPALVSPRKRQGATGWACEQQFFCTSQWIPVTTKTTSIQPAMFLLVLKGCSPVYLLYWEMESQGLLVYFLQLRSRLRFSKRPETLSCCTAAAT